MQTENNTPLLAKSDDKIALVNEKTILAEKIKKMLEKHPDKIPVIISKSPHDKSLPDIVGQEDQENSVCTGKFLIPKDLPMQQLVMVIRKRVKLTPQQAIFMFVNDQTVRGDELICQVYEKNKNPETGALHVIYTGEAAFGASY